MSSCWSLKTIYCIEPRKRSIVCQRQEKYIADDVRQFQGGAEVRVTDEYIDIDEYMTNQDVENSRSNSSDSVLYGYSTLVDRVSQ